MPIGQFTESAPIEIKPKELDLKDSVEVSVEAAQFLRVVTDENKVKFTKNLRQDYDRLQQQGRTGELYVQLFLKDPKFSVLALAQSINRKLYNERYLGRVDIGTESPWYVAKNDLSGFKRANRYPDGYESCARLALSDSPNPRTPSLFFTDEPFMKTGKGNGETSQFDLFEREQRNVEEGSAYNLADINGAGYLYLNLQHEIRGIPQINWGEGVARIMRMGPIAVKAYRFIPALGEKKVMRTAAIGCNGPNDILLGYSDMKAHTTVGIGLSIGLNEM